MKLTRLKESVSVLSFHLKKTVHPHLWNICSIMEIFHSIHKIETLACAFVLKGITQLY